MDAIAVVDGTGRWWDKDYDQDMGQSFCRQIAKSFRGMAEYKRGPSDEGYRFNDKAADAARFLIQARTKGAERLFLAGYSRGAAIVLGAAELLELHGIEVDGLLLLDPVERVPRRNSVCVKSVPQNVRFSRTASRSLNPVIVNKYEGTLLIKPYNLLPIATKRDARLLEKMPFVDANPLLGNPIRPEFGTFTVTYCGKGDHDSKTFIGSHGAIGGVGWADVSEDAACQAAVATWTNKAFRSLSLKMEITPTTPKTKFEA